MENAFFLLLVVFLLGTHLKNDVLAAETHFGNCFRADYGHGRCTYRINCDFYDAGVLDASNNRQCYSQQRPDLICCPREKNALPLVAPRLNNNNTLRTLVGNSVPRVATSSLNGDELPKHPNCGTAFAFRVYGGNITGLMEFPWTTLLEYTLIPSGQKQHSCGASFIAGRWLLTAAHCVHDQFVGNGRKLTGARLGEWNQTSNPDCISHWNGKRECAPPHIQARIDRAIIHPQFDPENFTNDIALLRLADSIDWEKLQHIEPVCLPPNRGPSADQLEGSAVDVSGWGLTEKDNQLSAVKRKAILHIQSQEQCRSAYSQQGFSITNSQVCASGGPNVDSCSGDSGGPLTVEAYTPQRDLFVYLVGIVSYGKKRCGVSDFPGVYTRVTSYMDWIEQTISNNSDVNRKRNS